MAEKRRQRRERAQRSGRRRRVARSVAGDAVQTAESKGLHLKKRRRNRECLGVAFFERSLGPSDFGEEGEAVAEATENSFASDGGTAQTERLEEDGEEEV